VLFNLDRKEMTSVPHERDFRMARARLTDEEYQAVVDAINEYVDEQNCFVSSYIPGSDWTCTVYQALYCACNQSQDQAGMFFGLIVWQVMMERDDEWFFRPADKDFDAVIGMTYFRKTD